MTTTHDDMKAELVAVLGEPNEYGVWNGKGGAYTRCVHSSKKKRWMVAFIQRSAELQFAEIQFYEVQFYETVEAFLDAAADHFDIPITPGWLESQGWVAGLGCYKKPMWRSRGHLRYYADPDNAVAIQISSDSRVKLPVVFKHRHQLLQLISGLNAGNE